MKQVDEIIHMAIPPDDTHKSLRRNEQIVGSRPERNSSLAPTIKQVVSLPMIIGILSALPTSEAQVCTPELEATCSPCLSDLQTVYNCSLPGLEGFAPGGQYEGIKANYLSFVTETSSPNLPIRAKEFEACTGGQIIFSEAENVWEDPVLDLGTKASQGSEIYDGYFMSYSHFPEVSALGLVEPLNDRIRNVNDRLKWEDTMPKVKNMGEYTKDGETSIDFLMYDGDFFVPIIRIDLLEKHNLPVPNTWDEVVEYAQRFNGTDLNEDGEPDYGFCHFPRVGAGYWDWWASEAVYAIWATFDQYKGINQGFFFDEHTMEPRLTKGFERAAQIFKELWTHGSDGCISPNFATGRCAIGFAPPGCWKGIFLNGIARRDDNGTTIWQPTMADGTYAEPYRFKPFGSLEVVDQETGELTQCTLRNKLCPKAEGIPTRGHHGPGDRANSLSASKHNGKLINRAPFYWSGGLGTLIRKSSPKEKKDLIWDFFVYTNSPETSVQDVAKYASWLDSWRYSQLSPGDNFIEAGWSEVAYKEHATIMQWALSREVNGAFNLRLPGLARYTRDVMGGTMQRFIEEEISIEGLVEEVRQGWIEVTEQEGKLDQLEVYRASLGLETLSEVDLCRLHRGLMDDKDPSVCRKYDPEGSNTMLIAILVPLSIIIAAAMAFVYFDRKSKAAQQLWKIDPDELMFYDPAIVLGRGYFGLVVKAEYQKTPVAVKRALPPRSLDSRKRELELEKQSIVSQKSDNGLGVAPLSSAMSSAAALSSAGSIFDESSVALENEEAGMRSVEKESSSGMKSTHVNSHSREWFPKSRWLKRTFAGAEHNKLKAGFVSEMQQLARLRHPCLVTVMGAVIRHEEPMLVMEMMDHGSLADMLQNETMIFDGELILTILRDIVNGVVFLHNASPPITHNDLKAANILVNDRFHAKVSDFGITRQAWGKGKREAVGTPFFLAPEVLRGETGNTEASDSYAFGVLISEIYNRKDPYHDCFEEPSEILRLIADPEVNKRPSISNDCPPKARALMEECLAADPRKRPTFVELELQLRRFDAGDVEPIGMDASKQTRTENLLFEVFPRHIAEALRDGKKVEPETRALVTIFFSDVCGFTDISSSLTPMKVADMLDRLYTKFDALCKAYTVHKVETIGDAFMAVTGLITEQPDQVKCIARFAVAAVQAANETLIDVEDSSKGYVQIRAGFSSGPVVANVVGSLAPRYCLFGDVVNVSSRMESTSKQNRIQCSELSATLLREQDPAMPMRPRGLTTIKGKGQMYTYWVNQRKVSESSYMSQEMEKSMSSHAGVKEGNGDHACHACDEKKEKENEKKEKAVKRRSLISTLKRSKTLQ